jgi:diguanylate cyclase (GGDEF)-like protein/PAS domain S-box-containing protein
VINTRSRNEETLPHPASPDDSWFRDMGEAAGEIYFVVQLKPDLAVEYFSESVVAKLGHTAGELHADPELLGQCVDPRDAAAFASVLAWPAGQEARHDLRWISTSGRSVSTQAWLRSIERPDGSVALEGIAHDVTELRQQHAALLVAEERYRLMAESANVVLWTMGLDGTITYVSPTVEKMRGFTVEEAMNQPLNEILTPESQQIAAGYYSVLYADIAAGRMPEPFRCEEEYFCKGGTTIWTEVDVIPELGPDGSVIGIIGITRDISDRKRATDALVAANDRLHELAVTDPLTGVWNRRHGEELLSADLAESRRYGPPMSLVVLDIDNFKQINDLHGHLVGDQVLAELTDRIGPNLRDSDALARWGGDEFVIITHHCGEAETLTLAEKLRDIVRAQPFGDAGPVTVSAGVAELRPDDDLDTWLSRADHALYEAKAAGRNAVRASH